MIFVDAWAAYIFHEGVSDRSLVTAPSGCGIVLQVLLSLQILARGNFMRDLRGRSFMSTASIHKAFHTFCERFAAEMFDEWIRLPVGEDLEKVMAAYDKLGFTGAMGSTDVTHVAFSHVSASHARSFIGKEGYATLAYQATVDHTGRAIAVTHGFPGAHNDKTIVRFDLAVDEVRHSEPYKSKEFALRNGDGSETMHTGAYLIVDGGYHRVSPRPMFVIWTSAEERSQEEFDKQRWHGASSCRAIEGSVTSYVINVIDATGVKSRLHNAR